MSIVTKSPARRIAGRAALVVALMLSSVAVVAAAPASAAHCRTDWGSIQKSAPGGIGPRHMTGVRTGRHSCFDRLVVDFQGARSGYHVDYVDSLFADGSGENVPVDGGAILQIITGPAYDDNGTATVDPAVVDATSVAGYRTFRDVAWAGSFEGQTTLGLGVRARLPYRVFALAGPGDGSRLVIDVAHSWNTPPPNDNIFPGRPGDELGVIGVTHDDVLNLRSGPGVNHRILLGVAPTDSVFATGRARTLSRSIWYEVSTRTGIRAWASARYLAIPGSTDDLTAAYLADHPRPSAASMADLGKLVALDFASDQPGSRIAMSLGPTVGDLGEVTYDVVGLGDDSVAGLRLHIFANPPDADDGNHDFELRSIEATVFCFRGFDGTSCV